MKLVQMIDIFDHFSTILKQNIDIILAILESVLE